ncbi:MAG TPA: hypothetical protein VFA53_01010 [Xanthobacteraceae bacterium]|nr:hypothetical protein [Xanthobacteraceae bacterium]
MPPRAVTVAACSVISLLLAAGWGQAQSPISAPAEPYEQVTVALAPAVKDHALDVFRKRLAAIASRKNRGQLAAVVAQDFFWERGPGIRAAAEKSPIDTFSEAIGLNSDDGWQSLADYANEPSVSRAPHREDLACTPAVPIFDAAQFAALLKATGSDFGEWGYPEQPAIPIHERPQPDSKVLDKLGMYFVRVLPDEMEAEQPGPMLRIVAPSGTLGYIDINLLLPLGIDQLCYKKESGAWKIAAYIGRGMSDSGGAPVE